jgi:hypothetical protein
VRKNYINAIVRKKAINKGKAMNTLEKKMLLLLKELKESYNSISIKTEFEAEGTNVEEILRLKDITMQAGLGLTMKIGGCEAVRDILESRIIGVNNLAAPMIESAYALRKFLQVVEKLFPLEERIHMEILCNIETITAVKNLKEILDVPNINVLNGIVIERVDLCRSLGMGAEEINDARINTLVLEILHTVKDKNLFCTLGGGVSADSLPFIRSIPKGLLRRFETRKVCFDLDDISSPEIAIMKALAFELLWLRNKMDFYKNISKNDRERMNHLEKRYLHDIDCMIQI